MKVVLSIVVRRESGEIEVLEAIADAPGYDGVGQLPLSLRRQLLAELEPMVGESEIIREPAFTDFNALANLHLSKRCEFGDKWLAAHNLLPKEEVTV